MSEQELNQKYQKISTEFEDMVETLNLKANLLKLESQDSWQKLKAGTKKLKQRFRHNLFEAKEDADSARVQCHLGWMEAKTEWDEFEEYLAEAVDVLKGTKKSLDEARLQTHLGKMELSERMQTKRQDWEKNYEQKVKPQLKQGMEKVAQDIQSLKNKLKEIK